MPVWLGPLVWGGAVPLAIGAAILALAGRRAAAAPVAFGAAVATAYAGLLAVPAFPAGDSIAWLFWIAIGAAGIGLLETAWRAPFPARVAIRLVLAEGLLFTLLRQPYLLETWSRGEAIAHLGGAGVAAVAVWTALDEGGERLPGARLPFLLASLAGGAAAVLGLTGSASLALLAGALAAATAPALPLAWLGRPRALAPGGVAAYSLVLTAVVVNGRYFSDAPLSCAILLAAAPVASLAGARLTGRFEGWKAVAGALAPGLLAIGAAVGIALASYEPPGPYGY